MTVAACLAGLAANAATLDVPPGGLDDALAQLQALPTVLAPIVRIRKEELS